VGAYFKTTAISATSLNTLPTGMKQSKNKRHQRFVKSTIIDFVYLWLAQDAIDGE
jgi:hypothetical protein